MRNGKTHKYEEFARELIGFEWYFLRRPNRIYWRVDHISEPFGRMVRR